MNDPGNNWSDERVELLKKLWADGHSASQIAAEMGGVTRNAVIGKVHRLGLSGRAKAPATAAARPPRKTATPGRVAAPAIQHGTVAVAMSGGHAGGHAVSGNTALATIMSADVEPVAQTVVAPRTDVVIPMSERVTIMDLRESMCRWPLGDPTTPDFRFCGAKSPIGTPYCAQHSRIAYQPPADRRRDRRMTEGK